jgi:signal peptidase I
LLRQTLKASLEAGVYGSAVLSAARRKGIVELVVTVAVAVFFVITVQAYAVKPYRVPSGSMEPTLRVGQRLIVDRFSHRFLSAKPKVGQIVVFHPPHGADPAEPICGAQGEGDGTRTPCDQPTAQRSSQTFVKRVVGVGGDRIAIRGGHVVRNGKLQSEPFAARCQPGGGCDFPHAVTVPKGYVYLMGDNRGDSDDSRYWGPVPIDWVIGKAVVTYWPPGRLGTL